MRLYVGVAIMVFFIAVAILEWSSQKMMSCNHCRKEPCWCGPSGGGVIQVFSGGMFHVLDPRPEEICIEDIAHGLSMLCRFTGQVRKFYSVAQHSVYVSQYCDPADAMWGLLHDSSENYIADVSRPAKSLPEMAAYKTIESRIMDAVMWQFGLSTEEPASVKRADILLCDIEARDLMSPAGMKWSWSGAAIGDCPLKITRGWSPEEAEERFMERYKELC